MNLTHISLFAGIGGIDIAAEWAGFKTVCFVEIDGYCQKVLKKHWPDVPIIGDIRYVTKEKIMAYAKGRESGESEAWNGGQDTGRGSEKTLVGNTQSNGSKEVTGFSEGENSNTRGVCGTDRRPRRITGQSPITLITGGFPCQPVSQAGKRKGKEDDRWLWPEMLRVISEIRSTWVVAENVAGLLNMGFNDCVSDLEGKGYETTSFLIPACAVNAPHRRDRIFIVGYSINAGNRTPKYGDNRDRSETDQGQEGQPQHRVSRPSNVADSISDGLEENTNDGHLCGKGNSKSSNFSLSKMRVWDTTAPPFTTFCGVADGIPNRVDRLKCLGNAVVPQQIYPILKAIVDIEA